MNYEMMTMKYKIVICAVNHTHFHKYICSYIHQNRRCFPS